MKPLAPIYTVDASVFVNAFNPHEQYHAVSLRFLNWLRTRSVPIVEPTLLLPEVTAAVARGRGNPDLAHRFAGALSRLPHLKLVPLDDILTEEAVLWAAEFRLRGSDAVYAGVTGHFKTTLVTLDGEQLKRLRQALPVRSPTELLQDLTSPTPS